MSVVLLQERSVHAYLVDLFSHMYMFSKPRAYACYITFREENRSMNLKLKASGQRDRNDESNTTLQRTKAGQLCSIDSECKPMVDRRNELQCVRA